MQLLSLSSRRARHVSALAFAPDSRALVACAPLAVPTLWELPVTGPPVALSDVSVPPTGAVTFSPDARVVGWLCKRARFERDRTAAEARPVKLTPDSEAILAQVACGTEGRLVLRTIEQGVQSIHRFRAFVPDGKGEWSGEWTIGHESIGVGWVFAGAVRAERFFFCEYPSTSQSRLRNLVVRSARTGEILESAPLGIKYVTGLAVAPDGVAAVCFEGSSLYAWRSGVKVEKVRTGTLKHYCALAFHPDGRHLLAGNNDTTARIIDTHTWQITRQFAWDIGTLTSVAVSPDGALAAAGGAKGRVVVWDLE